MKSVVVRDIIWYHFLSVKILSFMFEFSTPVPIQKPLLLSVLQLLPLKRHSTSSFPDFHWSNPNIFHHWTFHLPGKLSLVSLCVILTALEWSQVAFGLVMSDPVRSRTVGLSLCVVVFLHPQRGWQLRGYAGDQGNHLPPRAGRVETAGHLQVVLWDRRRIFPLWRANLRFEIR